MLDQLINALNASSLYLKSEKVTTIKHIEDEFKFTLPQELKKLLSTFDSSIIFNNGAKIIPLQKSPYTNSDGYLPLEIIYGLEDSDNNLIIKNHMYEEVNKRGFFIFGESSGGDQLCIHKENMKVYCWDHESNEGNNEFFEVSTNFDDFLSNLEPDNTNMAQKEIDSDNSFLDF